MNLREIGWGVWSGFTWLRIGIFVGLLWMRWWTFGFRRHEVSSEQIACKYSVCWCMYVGPWRWNQYVPSKRHVPKAYIAIQCSQPLSPYLRSYQLICSVCAHARLYRLWDSEVTCWLFT
jgi:hypothetical protein